MFYFVMFEALAVKSPQQQVEHQVDLQVDFYISNCNFQYLYNIL